MRDVARHAGVSVSTVSYVLSGSRPISDKTKKRINKAIEILRFKPNVLAQGLATRRSGIVALLFSPSERGLGITELEFVESAADTARAMGYHLVLWTTGRNSSEELRQLKQRGLVDGVLLMEVRLRDERVRVLRRLGLPFSIIGRCENLKGIAFADIDFDATMSEALRHLQDLGHRKIGFLNQSKETYDQGYGPAVRSLAAFKRLCGERGIQGRSCFCHASPRDGYEACQRLLDRDPDLTALVAMNDRALPGVMQALADRHRRVPEDFSLLATVSSAKAGEMMVPPLTTTDVPGAELGRLGVKHLIHQIESGVTDVPGELLPCRLSVRGSTGPCWT